MKNTEFGFALFGGDEEDRTPDLTDANRTRSQLRYAPVSPNKKYYTGTGVVCQVFFQNFP